MSELEIRQAIWDWSTNHIWISGRTNLNLWSQLSPAINWKCPPTSFLPQIDIYSNARRQLRECRPSPKNDLEEGEEETRVCVDIVGGPSNATNIWSVTCEPVCSPFKDPSDVHS